MTTNAQAAASNTDKIGMTEKQSPTVTLVNGETIINCCAWCFPGAKLVEAFPAYLGLKVSHGICKPHRAELYKDFSAHEIKMAA